MGKKRWSKESLLAFEGLRRTGLILKDFPREQRGQLLENHRSFGVMFPGKVWCGPLKRWLVLQEE